MHFIAWFSVSHSMNRLVVSTSDTSNGLGKVVGEEDAYSVNFAVGSCMVFYLYAEIAVSGLVLAAWDNMEGGANGT